MNINKFSIFNPLKLTTMKNEKEILLEMIECSDKLRELTEAYQGMHQIDMQSGYGEQMRENINILKGQLKALVWVLNN